LGIIYRYFLVPVGGQRGSFKKEQIMTELDLIVIDEEAFALNYADAKAYHNRALQFMSAGERPSLVFNIASIALERYLVAICDLYGAEPKNHNYSILMKDVEKYVEVPKELKKRIKAMDWIFGICSIDEFRHPNPDESDRDNALYLCVEIEKLFDQKRIETLMAKSKIEPALN